MAWCAEELAVMDCNWLGILPSEFDSLQNENPLRQMTNNDMSKLDQIMDRQFYELEYEEELKKLKQNGRKAEIEDFDSVSNYLWQKLEPLVDED